MLGRVAWDSRPGRTELGLERLGGMTLARATVHVPPGLGRFRFRARLRRARRFFEQNGVRRIILPESGENSWFSGFGRVDALPFYRAVADLLALGALETAGLRPEQASVALSGPRLCPELRAAAERLYPQVRGLVINVPGEGARLRRLAPPQVRPAGLPARAGGCDGGLWPRRGPPGSGAGSV